MADGFSAVEIAPQFGPLARIKATMPTPKGPISLDLAHAGTAVSGRIDVPPGLPAHFLWRGRRIALRAGENPVRTT